VGVAHNKLLAKIASDLEKPDGLCAIAPQDVERILDPLPVRRLSGIGAKTAARLEAAAIHTFRELRTAPDATLWPLFGKYTTRVRERAAGIDERPVVPEWQEKQISAEETFESDLQQRDAMRAELARLADKVGTRLRAKALLCSTVTVKLRRRDFTTYTRSRSFRPPTQDTGTVLDVAGELLDGWLGEQPRVAVRLLGVGLSTFSPATQLDLFAAASAAPAVGAPPVRHPERLDPTLDRIRERFGSAAVTRASSLERPDKEDGFTGVRRRT
jgi:DNA polymerase-4